LQNAGRHEFSKGFGKVFDEAKNFQKSLRQHQKLLAFLLASQK